MEKNTSLTPTDWKRIKLLFTELIELSDDEVEINLKTIEKNEPNIYSMVNQMIKTHFDSDQLTITPGKSAVNEIIEHAQLKKGDTFGLYTIQSALGHGGMGQVYLAKRDDAVSQQVAIKVLSKQLMDTQSMARFDTERRILASLEHPNIARLIDAGNLNERAYYVMEYIDGIPIDQFCEQNLLSLDDRLKLFIKVCEAVSYAHNNLIVHRDLKPENILVNKNGEVKLLDFGIAKPLKILPGTERIHETLVGTTALTPQYAAPEQIKGDAITVACDIYVLGLLLYKLLTGKHAHDLSAKTWGEIEQIINQSVPTLPSKKVNKDNDNLYQKRWHKSLKGELDAIISHALKKEPEKRYGSVRELLSDINSYLNNESISIKKDQSLYRAKKILSKHWLPITALTAIFFITIASSVYIWIQSQTISYERDLALIEKQTAEGVTDFLIDTFQAADPTKTLGDKVTAANILQQAERNIKTQNLSATVENKLIATLSEVYFNLSEYETAETLLKTYQNNLLSKEEDLSVAMLTSEITYQKADYQEALAQLDQLIQSLNNKNKLYFQANIMKTKVLKQLRQLDEAKQLATEIVNEAVINHSKNSIEYVLSLVNEASIYSEQGNREVTLSKYLDALSIIQSDIPNEVILKAKLQRAVSIKYVGLLEFEKSLEFAQLAYQTVTEIYGQDNLQSASYLHVVALSKQKLKQYQKALEDYYSSLQTRINFLGEDSPKLAASYYSIAVVKSAFLKQEDVALPYYEKVESLMSAAKDNNYRTLQIMRLDYTRTLVELGQIKKAKDMLHEMLEYFNGIQTIAGMNIATTKNYLAYAYLKSGDHKTAQSLSSESFPVLYKRLGEHDIRLITAIKIKNLLKEL